MKGKKLLITLAASAILFAGCGLKSGNTVIKVNDVKITQAQYEKKLEEAFKSSMFAQMGMDIKDSKNAFVINILKQRVVNELIVKALLDSEIEKRGIKVSNKDIEDGIKQIIDKVGSKEQLDAILKHNNVSPAQFKRDVAEQVKLEKLSEQLGDSTVTDADAKQFYDKNVDKFTHPEEVRASHILILANPDNFKKEYEAANEGKEISDSELNKYIADKMTEKRQAISEIHKQLKADPSQFAKIAKEKSEDTGSAERNGDLGFFSKGKMVPEFEKAAFSIKPNTVSEVVQTTYGYHILMVTDRRAAGTDPYEKAKDSIKAYLKKEKQVKYVDDLVESMKKNATIEYVDASFDPDKIQEEVKKQLTIDAQAGAPQEEAPQPKK